MEEFIKLVDQYQCKTHVDVSSSSDSESDGERDSAGKTNITSSGVAELNGVIKGVRDAEVENSRRKSGARRLPTRRPDPNVYNRNALLARENRRKKKAYMEAVEKELDETRNTNRSLLKALKKQFKLTKKLEQECEYLRNIKSVQSADNCRSSEVGVINYRPVSPEGSLISTYSSSSSNREQHEPTPPLEENPLGDLLSIDNGSVAEHRYTDEATDCSWNDFIDNLLADYQPTPEYETDNFLKQSSFGSQLHPLEVINEHSYFNKFADLDVSPTWEWSDCRTPPTQLLQDEDLMDLTSL